MATAERAQSDWESVLLGISYELITKDFSPLTDIFPFLFSSLSLPVIYYVAPCLSFSLHLLFFVYGLSTCVSLLFIFLSIHFCFSVSAYVHLPLPVYYSLSVSNSQLLLSLSLSLGFLCLLFKGCLPLSSHINKHPYHNLTTLPNITCSTSVFKLLGMYRDAQGCTHLLPVLLGVLLGTHSHSHGHI